MNKKETERNDQELEIVSGGRIIRATDGSYMVVADKKEDYGSFDFFGSTSSKFKAKHIAKKHGVSIDGI